MNVGSIPAGGTQHLAGLSITWGERRPTGEIRAGWKRRKPFIVCSVTTDVRHSGTVEGFHLHRSFICSSKYGSSKYGNHIDQVGMLLQTSTGRGILHSTLVPKIDP